MEALPNNYFEYPTAGPSTIGGLRPPHIQAFQSDTGRPEEPEGLDALHPPLAMPRETYSTTITATVGLNPINVINVINVVLL
jgi:hypothetical protein